MRDRELALKLVLDAINVEPSIRTVDERLKIQKSVYIAQECGIPLGYGYSWYVKGPYSPSLTQDYYGLEATLAAGGPPTAGLELNDAYKDSAFRARRILEEPVHIQTKHWYEAVCSIHYLTKYSRKSKAEAKQFMEQVKPHLRDIFDQAYERLSQTGLI